MFKKLVFPQRIESQNGVFPWLNLTGVGERIDHTESLVELTKGLKPVDFSAVNLDDKTPQRFSNTSSAEERIKMITESRIGEATKVRIASWLASAAILTSEGQPTVASLAVVNLARHQGSSNLTQPATRPERVLRKARSLIGAEEDKKSRLLTGWIPKKVIESSGINDAVLVHGLATYALFGALRAGLTEVRILRDPDYNPLAVRTIEDEIDIERFGFVRCPEYDTETVEGNDYNGEAYSVDPHEAALTFTA